MEEGRVALLRHDFRHEYGCSYDEVPTEEAIDLVRTLGPRSLYRASIDPAQAWDERDNLLADVYDNLWRLMQLHATGSTEDAPRMTRPGDAERREAAERAARAKAKATRSRIEGGSWEAV